MIAAILVIWTFALLACVVVCALKGKWGAVAAGLLLPLVVGALLLADFRAYRMPSAGMEPTLLCEDVGLDTGCSGDASDRFMAVKYRFGVEPGVGDIAAFRPPAAAEKCQATGVNVKRIVAGPGDTVALIRGGLLVNGEAVEEPYVAPGDTTTFREETVPTGMYFVLGDNRAQSCDSRVYGFVARDDLIARVIWRYWPLDCIGRP